ncbi:MAG: Plasmid stabilization system protein [Firmicutes bacterium ADurb.Bin300]|jgi:toxin ParE1/3/4|nr:MAG: Plasmid stabilization system protein [Firmicutes bacterium ADurb.Bin300]
MKIVYAPQAKADLSEIRGYIRDELKNPAAAKNTVEKILKTCNLLAANPNAGFALEGKIGRESDYRCLVSGNYIAFYRVENRVEIMRILDGRTDPMRVVFGSATI